MRYVKKLLLSKLKRIVYIFSSTQNDRRRHSPSIDNQKRSSILAHLLYTGGMITLLASCGGAPIKKENTNRIDAPPQKGTLVYIPIQKTDKNGQTLPYQPMANPYLAQTGKINLEAVNGFIAARRAIKAKQFNEAVALLDKAITDDATLAGPWVMKGDIALIQNQLEDAIKDYQQAVSVNALNVNAYLKLAKALRIQGKYQQAQNVYANALSVWRDFPEAHLNLAVLYDVYLNNPVSAQRHMEAYQFLTASKDAKVAGWLQEIRSRSDAEAMLIQKEESSASQISTSEGEKIDP